MATVTEVQDECLEVLGVLIIGQVPQDQDRVRSVRFYNSAYSDLQNDGLTTWISTGPVPDSVRPHLVAMMAMDGTATYAVSPQRYQRIEAKAAGARRAIRRLVRMPYNGLGDVVDY